MPATVAAIVLALSISTAWGQRVIRPAVPVQSQNMEFIKAVHASLECLKRQAEVLERLEAPAREIARVRAGDGRHYLRDEYGNYYKAPQPGHTWWDPSAFDPREVRDKK